MYLCPPEMSRETPAVKAKYDIALHAISKARDEGQFSMQRALKLRAEGGDVREAYLLALGAAKSFNKANLLMAEFWKTKR